MCSLRRRAALGAGARLGVLSLPILFWNIIYVITPFWSHINEKSNFLHKVKTHWDSIQVKSIRASFTPGPSLTVQKSLWTVTIFYYLISDFNPIAFRLTHYQGIHSLRLYTGQEYSSQLYTRTLSHCSDIFVNCPKIYYLISDFISIDLWLSHYQGIQFLARTVETHSESIQVKSIRASFTPGPSLTVQKSLWTVTIFYYLISDFNSIAFQLTHYQGIQFLARTVKTHSDAIQVKSIHPSRTPGPSLTVQTSLWTVPNCYYLISDIFHSHSSI